MNAHMSGVDELNQEMGRGGDGGGMEAKRGIAGWKSAFSPFTNNRISGHEDRIKQGQAMHRAADLGLGIC